MYNATWKPGAIHTNIVHQIMGARPDIVVDNVKKLWAVLDEIMGQPAILAL